MTFKPILFNTDMVCAILDGRKTVTRRICKDANKYSKPLNDFIDSEKRTYAVRYYQREGYNIEDCISMCETNMPICVGDILWVRETFFREECAQNCAGHIDLDECPFNHVGDFCYGYKTQYTDSTGNEIKWHPSIHMPKEAARIFLRVKDVKVEQLQEIDKQWENYDKEGMRNPALENISIAMQEKFISIWDGTIKKAALPQYGWNANPWVWVIEFERCEKPEGWPQC